MNWLIALHVVAACFWAGATLFLVLFVGPTVVRAGADGGAFMQRLAVTSRFPVALGIAGATTILSGFVLMGLVSSGFQPAFFQSGMGRLLGAGAACGILAVVTGIVTGRMRERGAPFAMATAFLLVMALVLMTLGAHP